MKFFYVLALLACEAPNELEGMVPGGDVECGELCPFPSECVRTRPLCLSEDHSEVNFCEWQIQNPEQPGWVCLVINAVPQVVVDFDGEPIAYFDGTPGVGK